MLKGHEIDTAIEVARLTHQSSESIVQEFANIKKAKEGVTDEDRKKFLIENARNLEEVAAAVVTNINVDVLAHMFALGFLQRVTLGSDQWPILTTDVRDKNYRCSYIGEDGTPRIKTRVSRRTETQYLLQLYSTEDVEYPLRSLQIGDVSEMDRVQRELSYELQLGIDGLARSLLDSSYLTSGLRDTLNLHSSIVAENIPDANYLDLSGSDSGTLTLAKLKSILDYFARFAADVELDGQPLNINTMYMSSRQIKDIWDFVDLVAGYSAGAGVVTDPKNTVPTEMRTGIFRSGKIMTDLFGYPVNIVTRNTITKGTVYISTNKPCGFFWEKPSYDAVNIDNSPKMRRKNLNSMQMEKTFALAIPEEWTYRYVFADLGT